MFPCQFPLRLILSKLTFSRLFLTWVPPSFLMHSLPPFPVLFLTGLAAFVSEESFHLPPSSYSLFFCLSVICLHSTRISKFFSSFFSPLPPISTTSVACPRILRQQVKCMQSPQPTTCTDLDQARSWTQGINISRIWQLFKVKVQIDFVRGVSLRWMPVPEDLNSQRHIKCIRSNLHCQKWTTVYFKLCSILCGYSGARWHHVCYSRVKYRTVWQADKL